MHSVLFLVLLFTIKHFVVDYVLQRKYQYLNKGIYGHPGGLLHAGLHCVGTVLCLFGSTNLLAMVLLGLLDGMIHYHVDWAKYNINKRMNWSPTTHDQYWILLGLDQFLHTLTYILIIWLII